MFEAVLMAMPEAPGLKEMPGNGMMLEKY